jgi:hypothetical protein
MITGNIVFFVVRMEQNMEILFIDSIQNFKDYSQFESLRDFNNQIEQWMVEYKHLFTPSELIALKRLIRYSAKVYGVSNAKINTILDSIEDKSNGYGISRSTFKRMLSKAKKIGLLEVKETARQNLSQSSNIYIFHRFNSIEPPQTEGERSEIPSEQEEVFKQLNRPKTINIFKTNKQKHTSEIDHTYLPSFVDESFIETTKPFFSAYEVYQLWLRVLIAYKKSGIKRPLQEVIETVNKAFKQTVFMYKLGKIQTSFEGYFYRLVENYLAIEKRREAKHLLYDWLGA